MDRCSSPRHEGPDLSAPVVATLERLLGDVESVDGTLPEAGLEPPDRLDPVLITRFGRGTLAARDGSARVTFDVDLHLEEPGSGASARIHDGLVVIETKTSDGDGRADRLLHDAGLEDLSLSQYRAGVG